MRTETVPTPATVTTDSILEHIYQRCRENDDGNEDASREIQALREGGRAGGYFEFTREIVTMVLSYDFVPCADGTRWCYTYF
jgi:hypothetical protein